MTDKQNESSVESHETGTGDVATEAKEENPVTEKCPRKPGGLGVASYLVFIIVVGIAAGAGWYYRAMWMPQAKQWLATLGGVGEERDPMAAPMPSGHESADTSGEEAKEPTAYVVPAIPDRGPTEPVAESTDELQATPGKTETVMSGSATTGMETTGATETVPSSDSEVVDPMANTTGEATGNTVTAMAMPQGTTNEKTPAAAKVSEPSPAVMTAPAPEPVSQATAETVTIAQARQAFWQRDLPAAESLYERLNASGAASADSWGELGNVYYRQAKWQQAATAYTEAALLLLDDKDFSQAMYMRYIVSGLDPAQAGRIEQRLHEMQAPVQ